MIVILLKKFSKKFEGQLSRYLLKIENGLFLGKCNNKKVQDDIIESVKNETKDDKYALILMSDRKKKCGFSYCQFGKNKRMLKEIGKITVIAKYNR